MTIELKKRILTGAFGAALLLGIIAYGGTLGILFLATLISFGMIFEFAEMTLSMSDRTEKRYLLLLLTWLVAILNFLIPHAEFSLLVFSFLSLFTYFLISAKNHGGIDQATHFKELMFAFFGLIYLGFIPTYFSRIYEVPSGSRWLMLFLFIVWAGDTGAYFAGKKFGKRKLYFAISPNKTIEGGIGGLAVSMFITLIFKLFFLQGMSWFLVFFVPLIVGITAQVGDLCESFLKRAFDKKDSGTILPGHGGFLDRFDGVVFSLPVMYACIRVLG